MLSELVLPSQILLQIVPIIVLFKNKHFLKLVLIFFINIHAITHVLLAIITMVYLLTNNMHLAKVYVIIY